MSKVQALQKFLLRNVDLNPVVRMGAGGAAAATANDAYLNQVHPDVSDLGRARSNISTGLLGALLSSRGTGKALRNAARTPSGRIGMGLTGTGAALRFRYAMPDFNHGGVGEMLDPGKPGVVKSVMKALQNDKVVDAVKQKVQKPLENATAAGTTFVFDRALSKYDNPEGQQQVADSIKQNLMPGAYRNLISILGGTPSENPDARELGVALAPHIVGGAGGGYLGNLAGHSIGNYLFADDPNKSYEERRRQENRRDWLGFAGSGVGMLGGFGAARLATPHLSTAIAGLAKKQASMGKTVAKFLQRSLSGAKDFGVAAGQNAGIGAGITATQYGLGVAPELTGDTANDATTAGALFGLNSVAAAPFYRKLLTNSRGFRNISPAARKAQRSFKQQLNGVMSDPGLDDKARQLKVLELSKSAPGITSGAGLDPLSHAATAGAITVSTPTIANAPSWVMPLREIMDVANTPEFANDIDNPGAAAERGFNKARAQRPLEKPVENFVTGVYERLGIPGVGEEGKKNLKNLTSAAALSTGLQAAGGGVGAIAGMTGGNWLADTLLQAAVKHKLLKDRPKLFKMLRTLGGLGGGALGAYAGLKGMDRAAPAIADWYKNKLESTTPPPTQA